MENIEDKDKHWKEVMDLAAIHGFIVQASAGVAVLVTHEIQKEKYGEKKYKEIQEMYRGGE